MISERLLDVFTCSIFFGSVVSEHKMCVYPADGGKVYPPTKYCLTQKAFSNTQ